MAQPDDPSALPAPELPREPRRSRGRPLLASPLARARGSAAAAFARRRFGPKARVALGRRLIAPLVLAVVPLYWVIDATQRATLTTLGRDQGIFQYIAWAVGEGDVDYRDVRDVNGPLVHLIHRVMLALGGADEHRFRVLDLTATGLSFAVVGALLPGIVARRSPTWPERAGWALASWVVLSGQYALHTHWNQAQRESFCGWFLLPSLALQIARPAEDARAASRRVVAVAALSTVTWFAKPNFVFFTVAQLAVLLIDRATLLSVGARVRSFVIGGALGALVPLLYLLRYGDLLAFLEITLRDVPRVYRFMWFRSAPEILGDAGPLDAATTALAASATLAALVASGALPRRVLALALAPIAAVLGAVAQHKGFGYHFHPVTATTHMAFMVIAVMLWERFRDAPRAEPLGRWIAIGAVAGYALTVACAMKKSPHLRHAWLLAGGETAERRSQREWFDAFKTHDFFPWELRESARFLAEHTRPDARVQTYGMDPYLLFLARRRSATPYIYAYDLNASAALEGGWSNEPTWAEREHILARRDAHEADMLARLREAPPEAFVFHDKSPLMSQPDAWRDFNDCCAQTAQWVGERYQRARSFGPIHVWLRSDLPAPVGPPPAP